MIKSEYTGPTETTSMYSNIIIVIFMCCNLQCIIFFNNLPCFSLYTDNEFLTNGVPKKNEKNNVKGKKRKKCLRDKTAPRPPHSGKR